MLDIQSEALAAQASTKAKGKRKAAALDADDSDDASDALHLDAPMSDSEDGDGEDGGAGMDVDREDGEDDDALPVPMPASGGIQALRDKLHARMAQLRQKGRGAAGAGEAGSRDELLEERRQQRAAMRERRRKETKEKIQREEERKGKGKGKEKGKEKEKQKQVKGPQTKVRFHICVLVERAPVYSRASADAITCPGQREGRITSRPQVEIRLHSVLDRLCERCLDLCAGPGEGKSEEVSPYHCVESDAGPRTTRSAQGEARGATRSRTCGEGGAREMGEGWSTGRRREGP